MNEMTVAGIRESLPSSEMVAAFDELVAAVRERDELREALTDLQGELSGTERRTYDDHSWANHVAIQVQKVMDLLDPKDGAS